MDLAATVLALGGLAAAHELRAEGATKRQLARAVAGGALVRIRHGWYALPGCEPALAAAARVGGRATCVTAADSYGLWTARPGAVHVRVPDHATQLRHPVDPRRRLRGSADAVVHWSRSEPGEDRLRLPLVEALTDMARCRPPEQVVAAVDCALGSRLITGEEWQSVLHGLPRRLRLLLMRVDPASGSYLESIVRFRLLALGIVPRSQVAIPGVGRVDFLLGNRVVVELDGWEHHRTREQFEEDRRRDAELVSRGYLVLRFTWRAITRDWRRVLAIIRRCLELDAGNA